MSTTHLTHKLERQRFDNELYDVTVDSQHVLAQQRPVYAHVVPVPVIEPRVQVVCQCPQTFASPADTFPATTPVAVCRHSEHVANVSVDQLDTEDSDSRVVHTLERIEYQSVALSRLHLIINSEAITLAETI